MKGLNLILFWIAWAFGGSLVWQIAFGMSSIDMLKEAITILMFAGIWEFAVGDYYRQQQELIDSKQRH